MNSTDSTVQIGPDRLTNVKAAGMSLIGGAPCSSGAPFRALDPRSGQPRQLTFTDASPAEVDEAARLAQDAFPALADLVPEKKAQLLEQIAANLRSLGDALIEVAAAETGLPAARLAGERERTSVQLEAFGRILRSGRHFDAIIDTANPDARPVPTPDLRRLQVPIGPVAVFGASNFPLAFSVAGGDTASALAAGCPVVFKAHPSHPETSEVTAYAVLAALAELGLPGGCFSLLQGASHASGLRLVQHSAIAAVGFTGSEAGGRALFNAAAARPVPIPVYAEMGSLNPVVLTERALDARAPEIAGGLSESILQGSGQFCTKPGLVFVPASAGGDRLLSDMLSRFAARTEPNYLLSKQIQQNFEERARRAAIPGVTQWQAPSAADGISVPTTASQLTASELQQHPELLEEHFGPACVFVRYDGAADLRAALELLPGSLTATLHSERDEPVNGWLIAQLSSRAGRVIWNQYPTGVAVIGSMHHGGPYPASTNAAHTSVGWTAIRRFQRPVSYQNTPNEFLPPALRDENPLGISRLVNEQESVLAL
jgi:acyl-CoA reductase-like NAD-dependent aldehyde dehydrogenase